MRKWLNFFIQTLMFLYWSMPLLSSGGKNQNNNPEDKGRFHTGGRGTVQGVSDLRRQQCRHILHPGRQYNHSGGRPWGQRHHQYPPRLQDRLHWGTRGIQSILQWTGQGHDYSWPWYLWQCQCHMVLDPERNHSFPPGGGNCEYGWLTANGVYHITGVFVCNAVIEFWKNELMSNIKFPFSDAFLYLVI